MLALFLALAVSGLSAWGFWVFNSGIITGKEKPNTAAWNLWVLLTFVNLSSYFTMNSDWYMSGLTITDTALCVVTWGIALGRGHFEPPPRRDYFPIALVIGAIVIWKFTSATDANLFTQLPIIISFVPYWTQVWTGEAKAKAWFIWTIAFALDLPLIVLRHSQTGRGDWHDYVYPGLGVILHGGIAVIGWYRQK